MTITSHHTPGCVQCNATDRHCDSKGIVIEHVNLSKDEAKLQELKDRGLTQAPVLIVTDDEGVEINHWTGFRPDKLDEYAAKQRELVAA